MAREEFAPLRECLPHDLFDAVRGMILLDIEGIPLSVEDIHHHFSWTLCGAEHGKRRVVRDRWRYRDGGLFGDSPRVISKTKGIFHGARNATYVPRTPVRKRNVEMRPTLTPREAPDPKERRRCPLVFELYRKFEEEKRNQARAFDGDDHPHGLIRGCCLIWWKGLKRESSVQHSPLDPDRERDDREEDKERVDEGR